MKFPKHNCGLHLNHNEHKNSYDSVEEFLDSLGEMYVFRSTDHRERCIETDELWTLQWYPDTPIGFLAIAAPTLEELLKFANDGY